VNPCPTPTAQATLTANPSTAVGGATVSLAGANFTPTRQVTLKYYKGNATSASITWTLTVACNGSFTTSVKTLTGLVRTDHVTATDTAGRTATANISILL
jgi:hypothetical protein